MISKFLLAALVAFTLAGCSSLGCAGAANDRASAGGCGAHVSF